MFFQKTGILAAGLIILAVFFCNPFSPDRAHAEVSAGQPSSEEEVKQQGYVMDYFPSGTLYEPYVADTQRIDFSFQELNYFRTTIPNSGSHRFDLRSGGRFGLVRIHPHNAEDLGWQLNLEAGINAQFDIDSRLDNIGWDGRYGVTLTGVLTRNLLLKFAHMHDSSHVGDEYAEKNGRRRIGYTREELEAAVSWLTDSGWRTYAEYGYGIYLADKAQKHGRGQFGLDKQPEKAGDGRRRGWYGGIDFSAMEERDWKLDAAVQTGYRWDIKDKTWRLGLSLYNGRPPIGEFFQYTESYLGIGLWVDL